MKKILFLTGALFLLSTFSPAGWAQGPAAGPPTTRLAPGYVQEITIIGKISREADDYVIVGQQPREIYFIRNPNPQILDRLAQSGQTVRIRARIILGDSVAIQRINGKPYPAERESKPKEKKGKSGREVGAGSS
ncbi:MAG: hypothetical protein JRI59_08675 [Deltaproteobacteria bacterium]|nr:hypothetical protein [Deltaproteobacteria bacterium]